MAEVMERLDQYLPSEVCYRVTDIDFQKWARDGVKVVFFDVEATLAETGSSELVPAYAGAVREAKLAGIEHVVLITNKSVDPARSNHDLHIFNEWTRQTDADLVLSPRQVEQRKPSPWMVHEGLSLINQQRQTAGRSLLTPQQAGMVDDKFTAGVRSARRAGLEHVAWTRSFGKQHLGDRLIRKPYEDIWRVVAHLRLDPVWHESMGDDVRQITQSRQFLNAMAQLVNEAESPANQVIGYGVAVPELPPELIETMKLPIYYEMLGAVKQLADRCGEVPADKLREFLYEHGRTTANLLTFSRLAIAGAYVMVRQLDLEPATLQRVNTCLTVLKDFTDWADGKAARAHKDGGTKAGGSHDQNIDKVVDAIIDIVVLYPHGLIGKGDIAVTEARDVGISFLRQPFAKRGMLTKSIWSGRYTTGAKGVVQLAARRLGQHNLSLERNIQHGLALAKVLSALHGPIVWIEDYERTIHDANNLQRWLGQRAVQGQLSLF